MFIETHYPMLGFVVVVVWMLFVKLSLIENARYPAGSGESFSGLPF